MSVSFLTTLASRSPVSEAVLRKVIRDILPVSYDLSIVYIGNPESKRLNTIYRKKKKPTNVLAFPISKKEGEIYITLPYAKKEAAKYDHTFRTHVLFLVIHGALHLKGLDHGVPMEKEENRLMKKFM